MPIKERVGLIRQLPVKQLVVVQEQGCSKIVGNPSAEEPDAPRSLQLLVTL